MVNILIPILVCLLGLVVFLVAGRGEKPSADWKEIGRIMFFCGLLVVLWHEPSRSLVIR
jgi:hypothetical protein